MTICIFFGCTITDDQSYYDLLFKEYYFLIDGKKCKYNEFDNIIDHTESKSVCEFYGKLYDDIIVDVSDESNEYDTSNVMNKNNEIIISADEFEFDDYGLHDVIFKFVDNNDVKIKMGNTWRRNMIVLAECSGDDSRFEKEISLETLIKFANTYKRLINEGRLDKNSKISMYSAS
jgi:hypothetical protein